MREGGEAEGAADLLLSRGQTLRRPWIALCGDSASGHGCTGPTGPVLPQIATLSDRNNLKTSDPKTPESDWLCGKGPPTFSTLVSHLAATIQFGFTRGRGAGTEADGRKHRRGKRAVENPGRLRHQDPGWAQRPTLQLSGR